MRTPRFVQRWRRKRSRLRKSSLTRVFRAIGRPFTRAWSWISHARKKRSLKNLWWGLPAVGLAVGAVALGAFSALTLSKHDREYRKIAFNSYQQGDFDSARVYLERVYRNGDTSPNVRYSLAAVLSGQGEAQRANAIIDSLSPEDQFGYPEAHLLKVQALLSSSGFSSDEHRRRAKHHLDASRDDQSAEWQKMMSRYYLLNKDLERGLKHLRIAASLDPALLYDLGTIYKTQGFSDVADETLERAQRHFERLIEQDIARKRQNDQSHLKAILNLGAVLTQRGDYDSAREALKRGLLLTPNGGPFGQALADVCLKQYYALLTQENSEPRKRLKLLTEAMTFDRSSLEAVRLLAFFGEETETGDATPELKKNAREFLEFMIASGDNSAVAHFALGTKAWADKDPSQAAYHLRRAYELDSSFATLANNLAWVLAHQEAPELDYALEIMNTVLEDYPHVPKYRDTRGQILAKMERWDAALDDLELALRSMRDDVDLHTCLAKVYRNISPPQDGLAKKHSQLAKALAVRSP